MTEIALSINYMDISCNSAVLNKKMLNIRMRKHARSGIMEGAKTSRGRHTSHVLIISRIGHFYLSFYTDVFSIEVIFN